MNISDQASSLQPVGEPFAARLASLIQHDPASRGIARLESALPLSTANQLTAITAGFRDRSSLCIALVTGFCIADAERPAAETDGPPGTLFLAQILADLGCEVTLLSDEFGRPLLEAGCDFLGLPRDRIATMPFESDDPAERARRENAPQFCQRTDRWVEQLLASPRLAKLSHLIAIERVGPSHTVESIRAQLPDNEALVDEFQRAVPPASRDVCHSMRGLPINAWTAKTHRLFEIARERQPDCVSVGVGDGGNEIGSGTIPWSVARDAIAGGQGARIACRVATDHFVLSGVSDWGAYALAAGLIRAFGRRDLVARFDAERQRALIETIVRETDAVDGMTRMRQATVDGLEMGAYLRTFTAIRELLASSGV